MKKTTKLLCGLLGVGFLLTGCATVSTIKNKESELVFNGNSAVLINDSYLYFGNSFADYTAFENDKDYKNSAKLSYLARLEAGAKLSSKDKDHSPKKVETVAKEVVAQEKSFMFAYGNYIYYLTPNRKKFENEDGKLVQQFGYSTLYRSKLNGDKKKSLYTTEAEVSQIEVLKYGKKYYIVMLAGSDLIRFEIGNKVKKTTLAKDVVTVALPETYEKNKVGSTLDWNGYIYYTKTRSDDDNPSVSGTSIMKLSIASGKESEVGGGQGKTFSLVGREKDIVFYTCDGQSYKTDTNEGKRINADKADLFYGSDISNVEQVYSDETLGYIYTANSILTYQTNAGLTSTLTLNYEGSALSDYNVLLVSGRTMYLSTTNSIYSADVSSVFAGNGSAVECKALVTLADDSIYNGNRYAFDGTYLYYYAKLQSIETDEEKSEEKTTDENYYMYRTKIGTSADEKTPYELVSLTKNSDRHSK